MESRLARFLRRSNRILLRFNIRFLLPAMLRSFPSTKIQPSAVKSKKPVLLFPYSTPACTLQHLSLSGALNDAGVFAEIANKFSKKSLAKDLPAEENSESIAFESFSELVSYLEDFSDGKPLVARGLIDEFVRKGPVSSMTGHPSIQKDFLTVSQARITAARDSVERSSGLVLADSAYLFNRSLMYFAETQGIPMWILNPDGVWLKASSMKDDAVNPAEYFEVRERIRQNPSIAERASRYAEKRFDGRSFNDLDSSGAFSGERQLPEWLSRRKILFLHAFRDASNIPLQSADGKPRALFRTYYEWADFVFSIISANPDEWAIRQHPSARFYQGDSEILNFLLKRHGAGEIPLLTEFSTLAILKNGSPIFTHSGTVSMESAAFGYKANICATKYPPEIAQQILDEDQLVSALQSSDENKIRQPVGHEAQEIAKAMLYLRYSATRSSFCPTIGQANRDKPELFQRNLLRQQLSLMRKATRADVRVDFRNKTAEVIFSLAGDASNAEA